VNPFFSIIIPTYNRANVLRKAIDSVLSQTFQDFEVIVVDDGSTDDTIGVIERMGNPKIQWISKTNNGVCSARNAGASFARGEFLIFLDSDDRLCSGYLTEAHQILHKKEYELLIGYAQLEHAGGHTIKRIEASNWEGRFHHPLTGAFTISKSLFTSIGGYDENLSFSETSDLFLRLVTLESLPPNRVSTSGAFGVIISIQDRKERKIRYSRKRYDSVKYFIQKHKTYLESSTRSFLNYKRIHARCALQHGLFGEATACLKEVVIRVPTSPRAWLHYVFVLFMPKLASLYYGR